MIPGAWLARWNEYRPIIEAAANTHGIPREIICGVISAESGWQPFAMRYEPDFTARYIVPKFPKSTPTFRVLHGSSWGLMQIMGLVARELGYQGSPLRLLQPEIGIDWGCRKLSALARRYGVGRDRLAEYGRRGVLGQDVIAAYNQGNDRWVDANRNGVHDEIEGYKNQEYVQKVLVFAAEFGRLIKELDGKKD